MAAGCIIASTTSAKLKFRRKVREAVIYDSLLGLLILKSPFPEFAKASKHDGIFAVVFYFR